VAVVALRSVTVTSVLDVAERLVITCHSGQEKRTIQLDGACARHFMETLRADV